MKNQSQQEREFTRLPVALHAELCVEEKVLCGELRNLSLKGAFFLTDQALKSGTTGSIELFFKGERSALTLQMTCEIIRTEADGIALTFTEIHLDSLEHLKNMLRGHAASDIESVEKEFDEHLGLKPRNG